MLMNYIFCGEHPFNQHVWILYTNRERKREITRNGETPRGWKTEKKVYILIEREASRFNNQCVRSGRTEVKAV